MECLLVTSVNVRVGSRSRDVIASTQLTRVPFVLGVNVLVKPMMNSRTKQLRRFDATTAHTPERFRSVLVPVDLTPSSDRVLGRLTKLPLADDVRITVLHVVPGSLPAREQRLATQDAKKLLASELQHLAESLPRGASIEPLVVTGSAPKEIARRASSAKAELIVMGRGGGRALRDTFLGSTAERVVRRCQLPVLVVRLAPRSAYRRPALALDLDRAAPAAVELMLRVLPAPRPKIVVVHAFQAPYQALAYPSLSEDHMTERRSDLQLDASQKLTKLLTTSVARAQGTPGDARTWRRHIAYGSPRTVIEKAAKKEDADLLVLGTHGHTGAAHIFLGTVAGDVLRHVACDVLLVPPRARPR